MGSPDTARGLQDRRCSCKRQRARGVVEFGIRYWDVYWHWGYLGSASLSNPTDWHAVAVEAIGKTFNCYLDGALCFSAEDISDTYRDGMVGLSVESGEALFDNVRVLDLRQ